MIITSNDDKPWKLHQMMTGHDNYIKWWQTILVTAWVLYKNSLYKNLRGSNPRRADFFSYTKHIILQEFEGPWNRIAKFLNYCLYVRFAIPLCGSCFLRCDPLWSYGMKSGFAEKQFFKLRKNVFFAHAWTASKPRKIYMWIDLGTWNIVFPNNLKKAEAFQKNNFSSSEKIVSFRTLDCVQSQNLYMDRLGDLKPGLATTLTSCARGVIVKGRLQETKKTTDWQTLLDAHRVCHQDLILQPSSLRSNTLTIMLQEPLHVLPIFRAEAVVLEHETHRKAQLEVPLRT